MAPSIPEPCLTLEAYLSRWYAGYAPFLAQRRAWWRDDVWEKGVLDLVSPLEASHRQEARSLGVGIPWGGRLDSELYWRIMYAAYAETLRVEAWLKPIENDPSAMVRTAVTGTLVALERRPSRVPPPEDARVLAYVDQTLGQTFYKDIMARAKHDIRLRSGNMITPVPIPPGARVTVEGMKALVSGFTGAGLIRLERETQPLESNGIEWTLHPGNGRYMARVMPWRVVRDE